MALTVVPIREDTTLVNDIPNQLRALADRLEQGDETAESMLCVIPRDGDWPDVFGWGEDLGEYGRIGVLALAQAWFAGRQVTR